MKRLIWLGLCFLLSLQLQANDLQQLKHLKQQLSQQKGDARIQTLHEISSWYAEQSDSHALPYSKEALEIAQREGSQSQQIQSILQLAETHIALNQFDEALDVLKQTEPLIQKGVRPRAEAQIYQCFGDAYKLNARYANAVWYLEKALSLYISLNEAEAEAKTRGELANALRYQGEYEQSAIHRYKAISYFESVGDSLYLAENLQGIAIIRYIMGEPQESLDILLENLDYYFHVDDSSRLAETYNVVGLCYFRLNDYKKSIDYTSQSLRIRRAMGDVRGQGESLNNLAIAYMSMKQWEKAEEALEESHQKLEEGNDFRQISVILKNLGVVKKNLGQPEEAVRYFKMAIERAKKSGSLYDLSSVYEDAAQIYAERNDFKSAFEFQHDYIQIRDSLLSIEKNRMLQELNLQYDTEKQNERIEQLKEEKKSQRIQMIGLGIGLGLLLIISMLAISLMRVRMQKDRKLHEQEMLIAKTREELTAAELRNAKSQLEINRNKLHNYTHSILGKNRLIEELEDQIKNMKVSDELQEHEKAQKLNELLAMKILTDEDWREFKRLFDQVYVGFFDDLNKAYPDLTVGETRLFILLKLNLSSKEISDILGISPGSVKKNRYRLRKKLQLERDDNLDEFVQGFE